jgi:hypothetical protein
MAQPTLFQASPRDLRVLSGHDISRVLPGRTEVGSREREETGQTSVYGQVGKSHQEQAPKLEQRPDSGQQTKTPSTYGRGA